LSQPQARCIQCRPFHPIYIFNPFHFYIIVPIHAKVLRGIVTSVNWKANGRTDGRSFSLPVLTRAEADTLPAREFAILIAAVGVGRWAAVVPCVVGACVGVR
jgi:hypothetical protein